MRIKLKYTFFVVLIFVQCQVGNICFAHTFVKDGGTTEYAPEILIAGTDIFDPYSRTAKHNPRILFEGLTELNPSIVNRLQVPRNESLNKFSGILSLQPYIRNTSNQKLLNKSRLDKTLFPTKRYLPTMIHFGFADFTTTVGESLIVFMPLSYKTSSEHFMSYDMETSVQSLTSAFDLKFPYKTTEIGSKKIHSIHNSTVDSYSTLSSFTVEKRENQFNEQRSTDKVLKHLHSSIIVPSKVVISPNSENYSGKIAETGEQENLEIILSPKKTKKLDVYDSNLMIRPLTYISTEIFKGSVDENSVNPEVESEIAYNTMYTIYSYLTTYLHNPSIALLSENGKSVNRTDHSRHFKNSVKKNEIDSSYSLFTTYYYHSNSDVMPDIELRKRHKNISVHPYSKINANMLEKSRQNKFYDSSVNMISSEPSILILQTGYTTHTYFITRYSGYEKNFRSHVETNTVTETKTYTSLLKNINTFYTLPITYYTTFTYFTKMSSMSQINTISREEIISNVIFPTNTFKNRPSVKTVISDLEDIPNIYELGTNSLNPISIDECSTYDSTLPTIQNNTLNYEVHMYTAPVKCHNNATITSNRRIRREAARSRFRKPKPIGESRYESNDNEEGNNLSTIQTQNTGLIRSRSDVRNKNLVASAHNIISSNKRLIRPSRVSSVASDRSKFTLRDKGLKTSTEKPVQRGNFRKPQAIINNKGRRPTSSFSTLLPGKRRPSSPPRDNESPTSTARNVVNQRRRNSNGGRPRMGSYRDTDNKSRNRISHEISSEVVGADSNGIITATYEMPEETILSTVNGKSTELKTIVTARKSLLVLNPQQYTKILGSNGQLSLALVSQSSSINSKGATEYTQFRLHEIQTTFVTFTPTTIRGRKTSFSLILPSTAYSVEHVVSTMQPNIQADTPLANILLSQLLLGNIGFPSNLLQGFHSDGVTQSTEYLTRTSTYLTTLYEGKSTVLPITFQGKKIYTTIYDTTAETITATEYITDTIVISPTHSQVPMVNSLLLQQLLLPQLNPQHQYNSNFNQVSATPQSLGSSMSLQEENVKYAYNMEVELEENIAELQTIPDMLRKSGKKHKRRRKDEAKLEDSSIITLYVSGKRPGEFSTILSTLKPDHSLPKRSIQSTIDINKIKNNIKTKVEPHTYGTTQSLNSVVGDVNKWFVGQGHCSSC